MRYPHTRLHRPPVYPDMVLRWVGAFGFTGAFVCIAWLIAIVMRFVLGL